MPSDSKTHDPRPAATEAARSYVMEFSEPTLENFLIRNDRDGLFRFIGSAVSEHQRRLNAAAPPSGQVDCDAVATVLDGYFPPDIVAHIITEARAAAPPSGQVTISEQTRQIALAILIERANDYIDAQELTPHYGTTATIGTPWDSAIAELAALKGAAR